VYAYAVYAHVWGCLWVSMRHLDDKCRCGVWRHGCVCCRRLVMSRRRICVCDVYVNVGV